jgi:hypothetical protein
MSMDIWLTRAIVVALSAEAWRLSHIDDKDLPNQQTLTALIREVDGESSWIGLLPDAIATNIRRLSAPLGHLLERRKAIIDSKVASASLDLGRVENYVGELIDDVQKSFGNHNDWLLQAGAVLADPTIGEDSQAGVSRLLPREWFVPAEVLDIPIHVMQSSVGRALIDFELLAIVRTLTTVISRVVEVPSPDDSRIWDFAREQLSRGTSHLLIVGVGISEYDVHEMFSRLREYAVENGGMNIVFETIRSSASPDRTLVIVDVTRAFSIVRRFPRLEGNAIYERSLPLEHGGVVSGIVEIDIELQESWTRTADGQERDRLLRRYRESVLDRTAWSFEVVLKHEDAFRIFRLHGEEGAEPPN